MKYLNAIYLRQTLDFFQRYGLKSILNKVPEYLMTTRGYQAWRKEHSPSEAELSNQRNLSLRMPSRPLFSILVPTYNTDPVQLKQMVESVFAQTYDRWELCIADGSPKPSPVEEFFHRYSREHNPKGNVCFTSIENLGIAGNTNAAMSMATGDFVVLLDHDDLLSPDALYELAHAINKDPAIDALYSDEDMVSADGTFLHNPNFKPDFSPDLLRTCNYITHLYAVRRSLAESVGGFSQDCDGSQDYDFTLKTTERARKVCHIPKVLYHWRVHSNSVAADSGNKTYAYDSAVRALERHYSRLGIEASVSKDAQPGFYLTDYRIKGRPLVSVLLYRCSETLRNELSHPAGAAEEGSRSDIEESLYRIEFPASLSEAHGEYILILHHVQSITPDTIRLLLSNCMRPEIGIAVPRILTSHGKVAESGLIYNKDGELLSPFAGKDPVYPGYHCYATCQHQISVAGPFCFMTSMENLRRNGRKKKGGSQDLFARMAEFCFRTRQSDKLITVIPRALATLTKTGSQIACSPRKGYPELLSMGLPETDPYYTPNFSQKHPYRF